MKDTQKPLWRYFCLALFPSGFFYGRKISSWIMIPRLNRVPDGHRLYLLRDILNIFGNKSMCFSLIMTNNNLNVWAVMWMICSIIAEGMLSQNIILDQIGSSGVSRNRVNLNCSCWSWVTVTDKRSRVAKAKNIMCWAILLQNHAVGMHNIRSLSEQLFRSGC